MELLWDIINIVAASITFGALFALLIYASVNAFKSRHTNTAEKLPEKAVFETLFSDALTTQNERNEHSYSTWHLQVETIQGSKLLLKHALYYRVVDHLIFLTKDQYLPIIVHRDIVTNIQWIPDSH